MTTLPNSFNYRGIYYYADGADCFYYIPGSPTSQATLQGYPTASMMVLEQFAMLQLSSEWSVSSEQLDQLKTSIEKQFDLSSVSLQPAPLLVESVELSLKTNKGGFEVLETSDSSGYLPFTALFSVQLDNEQKAQAIAAFNGRKEQLMITYKAALKIELSAEVTITGDVTEVLKKLKNPTLADCEKQIEIAIAQHRLKLEQSSEGSEDLLARTIQLAKERAAELLLSMAEGDSFDRSHFQASATLTEDAPMMIERSTDISTWFPNGNGMDYVQILTV